MNKCEKCRKEIHDDFYICIACYTLEEENKILVNWNNPEFLKGIIAILSVSGFIFLTIAVAAYRGFIF